MQDCEGDDVLSRTMMGLMLLRVAVVANVECFEVACVAKVAVYTWVLGDHGWLVEVPNIFHVSCTCPRLEDKRRVGSNKHCNCI